MTASEFKHLLATKSVAKNITVDEPVFWLIDDTHDFPLSGDVRIINCTIPRIYMSYRELDSLTITNGQVGEVSLQTGTRFNRVYLNRCDVGKFKINESSILSNFIFKASEARQPIIEEAGGSVGIKSIQLIGAFASIHTWQLGCESLLLKDFVCGNADIIQLVNCNMKFSDVKGDRLLFKFAPNVGLNQIIATNLEAMRLEVLRGDYETLAFSGSENVSYKIQSLNHTLGK